MVSRSGAGPRPRLLLGEIARSVADDPAPEPDPEAEAEAEAEAEDDVDEDEEEEEEGGSP